MGATVGLILSGLLFIACAHSARAVRKTTGHGDSILTYVLVGGVGLWLSGIFANQLWVQSPVAATFITVALVALGIYAIPLKRRLTQRIDSRNKVRS